MIFRDLVFDVHGDKVDDFLRFVLKYGINVFNRLSPFCINIYGSVEGPCFALEVSQQRDLLM